MALPTGTGANASGGIGSAKGTMVIAWTDAETAASSTAKFTPLALTTLVKPIELGDGVTRVLLRGRMPVATDTITTSPVVWVYGVWPGQGNPDDIASGIIGRVDNADQDAAGLTLTLGVGSPTTSNSVNDGTYFYGDWVSLDGVDLKGAKWLLVVVTTAADVGGTGSACDIQALVID